LLVVALCVTHSPYGRVLRLRQSGLAPPTSLYPVWFYTNTVFAPGGAPALPAACSPWRSSCAFGCHEPHFWAGRDDD
jgi:hypothetical protein